MMFGRKVHLREITAIIITANHEISRLAINPNSALIIVSGLLIFSSLISLIGQYVISSLPAAIIHCCHFSSQNSKVLTLQGYQDQSVQWWF